MVITFVIDMIGAANNGTTITAMRSAELLQQRGHEIRFISYVPEDHVELSFPDVTLKTKKIYFGPFESLVRAHGMALSYLTNEKLREAKKFLEGSDIVHLMMDTVLNKQVRLLAKSMGIPISAAMHVQPESLTYNFSYFIGKSRFINHLVYRSLYKTLYRYVKNIHTPSQMMKDQMIKNGYSNDIYVISNGASSKFVPLTTQKPEALSDKFIILMIGRLSREKRQDVLIRAIGASKYNDKIQLILCGQGPLKSYYDELSEKYLSHPYIHRFVAQEELLNIIGYTDLYVHASDAESEGIACIEAFRCGRVPLISDSDVSATKRFALDKKCLFKKADWKDLSKKIDYFIEHPEEKESLSHRYIEYGQQFDLDKCVVQLEEMFRKTISEENVLKTQKLAYFSSGKEVLLLKRIAKIAGVKNPVIFKNSAHNNSLSNFKRKKSTSD